MLAIIKDIALLIAHFDAADRYSNSDLIEVGVIRINGLESCMLNVLLPSITTKLITNKKEKQRKTQQRNEEEENQQHTKYVQHIDQISL